MLPNIPVVILLSSFLRLHFSFSDRPHYNFTLQKSPIFISTNPKSQNIFWGDNLTLSCGARLSSISKVNVHWRFNNDVISGNYTLSNNYITSVLHKQNVSHTDSGKYECLILDGIDSSGNSAMTTVSKGANIKVLDYHLKGETFQPIAGYLGEDVILSCDMNGSNSSPVMWYKDKWDCPMNSTFRNGLLLIQDMSSGDEGIYFCSFSNNMKFISLFNVSLHSGSERYPEINNSRRISEKYVSPSSFATFITLECPISTGSNIIQRWYRNGVDITSAVTLVPGQTRSTWQYNSNQLKQGSASGLYQCFISNSLGIDYSVTRVLILGFSNPPENFECKALDQVSNPEKPRIVLSWKQPTLNTKDSNTKYIITYRSYLRNDDIITENTTHEIPLSLDYQPFQLHVSVMKEQDDPLDLDGTPALCTITETIERRTKPENARRLEVTCSNGTTRGKFLWRSPQLSNLDFDITLFLQNFRLLGVCLLSNNFSIIVNQSKSLEFAETTPDNIIVDFPSQLSGSLCFYGGNYNFQTRRSTVLRIPMEACIYPMFHSEHRMWVSCNSSSVVLHVNLENFSADFISIQLTGNCILDDFTIMNISLDENVTSALQIKVFDSMLNLQACSFAVNLKDNAKTYQTDLQCHNLETGFFHVGYPNKAEEIGFSSTSIAGEISLNNGEFEYSNTTTKSSVTTEIEVSSHLQIVLVTVLPGSISIITVTIIIVVFWIIRKSGQHALTWRQGIHVKTFPELERTNGNCGPDLNCTTKYLEDARSDITVLDSLNEGYQKTGRLSYDCQSDYRYCSSTYFDGSYIGTQSSGYGTETDVSFRDYFLARDVNMYDIKTRT